MNGGGEPDFAVGAPDFTESENTLEGVCTGLCPKVGRVYIFHGEAITGSSQTPLTEATDPAALISQFPGAIGEGEAPRYGASLGPVGDSGRCSDAPDPNRPGCDVRQACRSRSRTSPTAGPIWWRERRAWTSRARSTRALCS